MHPGLVRLLDLIRVNPQDTLLVDRFLILASDLEETSRADATLGLSEALLRKNPRRAIELAHMVYKAKPDNPQPIELMVEGLENLGRYGKATVLRAQLEKVRKAGGVDGGSSREVTEASVMTIEKELKFLAGIELSSPSLSPNEPRSADEQKSVDLLAAEVPASVEKGNLSGPAQTILLGQRQKPEAEEHALQKTSVAPSLDLIPSHEMKIPVHRATQFSQAKADGIGGHSHVAPGIPVFREIVREVDAAVEVNIDQGPLSMVSNVREAAAEFMQHSHHQIHYGDLEEQMLGKVRAFIQVEDWDGAWEVIDQNWPKADNAQAILLFKELKLERIDLRYMGWWLDALVFDRRPRYALTLMLDLLREQPHISLAKQLIGRIQNTLKVLGYRRVDWAESEGILALLRKLDLSKLQSPAGVAILRPKRAS